MRLRSFLLLLLELADGQVGLGALGLDAPAGEEREIEAGLVLVDRDDAGGREPLLHPEAAQRKLGQPLVGRGSGSSSARCSWASDLAQFGAGGIGALQGLIHRDRRGIEEAHLVGQFDLALWDRR